MEYSPMLIGKYIRRLRRSQKQSQEIFSGLAGIDRSHLAKIERGEKAANIETLAKISWVFDMKLRRRKRSSRFFSEKAMMNLYRSRKWC